MPPGIEETMKRLMDTYGNEILRIAYVYVKDESFAQDIFQEVLIKAYKNYSSFRHESSERTWLIRITINTCKDHLRSSWMKRVEVKEALELNQVPDESDDFLERLSKKEIFETILELDEKYKDVILLFYYEGYKVQEIASILQTTTGNVSSLLSRARGQLKRLLNDEVIR